jgi:hypothetical protein
MRDELENIWGKSDVQAFPWKMKRYVVPVLN